jgi:Cu2+-exporting ATPase
VGVVTLAVWLAVGESFQYALARMVTVMVITCPHALGLAVPLVVAVSTTLSAKSGLLIRDRQAFERARNLDTVIFDKTGTLTQGRFGVSDVVAIGDRSEDDVLALAATLESRSEHPIAAGIVDAAKERDLTIGEAKDFENLKGRGAKATIDGRTVTVASPGYIEEQEITIDDDRVADLRKGGKTVVFVLDEGTAVGAIALSDLVREESRDAIARLKERNIRCLMLTGDSQAVAEAVAEELGLDDVFAEVLPDHKAEKVREAKQQGGVVAMVGDGVNDAPALLEADLGIAIGAGTDVAIDSADIVLVRDDPRDVLAILTLSKATWRKMLQNFGLATGYNVVAIPLAAGVGVAWGIVLSPAVGAALMSLSTVLVAINAKLLERVKKDISA